MADGLVLHASEVDFERRVLEASAERAVLVDFWASWCAPCRALAPVLEDLATRHPEGLAVVKVDTDAEQALASRYGIRSLPTLLVFRHGEVVAQTMGAQPLAALERLIEPHLPRATDALLAAAHAAEALGDAATAIAELERAHDVDASDYRVHPRLAALYVDAGRATEARVLLAALPANLQVDAAVEAVEARLRLAEAAQAAPADDEVALAYRAAVDAAARGDFDTAAEGLLALLPRHRAWQDDAVRKALLDIFNVVGADPRVKGWRTRLARSLN